MQCICQRELLNAALTHASRAVSAHATIDVLKGLLLEAEGDSLRITGNDLDMGIVAVIPAHVPEPGAAVLDTRLLCEMVRRVNAESVTLRINERYMATLSGGDSIFDITALPADNYPVLPEVTGLRSLALSQPALHRLLDKTLFAVSDSDAKVVHTGALFDVEPGRVTVVALDGHRLALHSEPTDADEAHGFVIPAASLRELEKMLEGDEESAATLHIGTHHVLIALPGLTLVSRLLEGEFLKYRKAIPQSMSFEALLEVRPFIQALERVGLIISEKLKNPVRLSFAEGQLRLHCQTAIGRAADTLLYEGSEEALEIGFNHRYLLDALRRAGTERFRFCTAGPLSPCMLLPEGDDDTEFMVLPVRLKAEG